MSTAMLKLSENGELQRIHKKWFCNTSCIVQSGINSEPDQLHFNSFWGLFLVCGVATVASLILFFLRSVWQFIRFNRKHREPASTCEPPNRGCTQVIFHFFDFIDKKEEAIKNAFKQRNTSLPESS